MCTYAYKNIFYDVDAFIIFLENGYVSGLCSRTQPSFYKILSKQADKIERSTQTT